MSRLLSLLRRRPLTERRLNYTRIGATLRAEELAEHPASLAEDTVRIGSGTARWEHAWTTTLSWGIQRHAGYVIDPASVPLKPGSSVLLRRRFGPLPMAMPVRVVDVIDEVDRKGFAVGTLAGHPVSGEVAFLVERHEDGSVWFVLRSVSGPGRGLWALAYPLVLLLRGGLRTSYEEALTGPL
jgi:uncharacterized protein (UPF0548 family)